MGRLLFLRPSNCHNAEKGRHNRNWALRQKPACWPFGSGIKKSQKLTDKQQSGKRGVAMNMSFYFSTKYSCGVCSITVSIESTSNQLPQSQSATCCKIMYLFSQELFNLCIRLVIAPISKAKSNMLSLFPLHLFSSLPAFLPLPRIS